eukprot:TRINITY_DN53136_c0_g1_i1.p1 TRINITY_DN53136_c0_g1~~TRINITY_DN53136_c0_g1_i1.p1  ORF type:complete len:412 (-),score=66.84 TRINITY_DN53136_c0_g1_i1:32-1267(-)
MDHSTSVPSLGFAGPGRLVPPTGSCSPASSACSPAKGAMSEPAQSGVFGRSAFGMDAVTPPMSVKRPRARPLTMLDFGEPPEDDECHAASSRSPSGQARVRSATEALPPPGPPTPSNRLPLGLANRKPRGMALCGSLLSVRSMSEASLQCPESPVPGREEFRHPAGGVAVVFFDFDGTLTATPGDRAARKTKQTELCDRAPMLGPRLRAMRGEGASLGIISKSSESTIRGALEASGLAKYFDAPLVPKAVGFEGKAGFVEELAQKGCLPRLGSSRGHGIPFNRILLVDDDILELERAKARGIQTYAAPADGGLQDEDFDVIIEALRIPRPKSHPHHLPSSPKHLPIAPPFLQKTPMSAPSFTSNGSPVRRHNRKSPPKEEQPLRLPSFQDLGRPGGRWRNLILFSGDCFEG